MLTNREKLADELAGIMYKQADCDDDNTWLESRKFHFVADQILFYLQAKDYLLPQLQQCDVSRSADIEELNAWMKKFRSFVAQHYEPQAGNGAITVIDEIDAWCKKKLEQEPHFG